MTSLGLIVLMGTKILTGFMFDKKGLRFTMNICLISTFISVVAQVFVDSTDLGIALSFVRLVFQDIALPLETVMLPLYASELFGNKSYMSVLGVFSAANYAGYALGSPIGNFIFDIFGSYDISFIVFGGLMVFVAIAMQYVVKQSRKDRAMIEGETTKAIENKKPSLFARVKWNKKVSPVIGYSLLFATISLALLIGVLVICL